MNDPRQLRDKLLVARCQFKEPHAFDELIRVWEPKLLYYSEGSCAVE